jgi:Zn ribbon nucleic-acid-binding protein
MNPICAVGKHKFGNMLFEENGSPYKVCVHCGERQNYAPKSLADLDKMTLDEVMKTTGNSQPITEEPSDVAFIMGVLRCEKCNGELHVVAPRVVMSGMTLMECQECMERCYK